MRRHRPRMEPLHAHGPCICSRSTITDIPWATRKTRGQVARPSHNTAAHFTTCVHSDLARTTTHDSVLVALSRLRGERRQKRRQRIARVVIVAV